MAAILKFQILPSSFFSRVVLFNFNIHTEFLNNRLTNFEDKNYSVRNPKWRISGKRSVFGKKNYS
jgi:hypothetical protein